MTHNYRLPQNRRALIDHIVATRYPDRRLSTKVMAKILGITQQHFSDGFKFLYGKTFKQHLNEFRFNQVVARLRAEPNGPFIATICRSAGLCRTELTYMMRATYGCSPKEFRKDPYQWDRPSALRAAYQEIKSRNHAVLVALAKE